MPPTTYRLSTDDTDYPNRLRTIPAAPANLFYAGVKLAHILQRPCLTIVGSRTVTPYGRRATRELAGRLAEQGMVIISGLALGVDSIAHQAALEAGGVTIAVLPGPVENIIPKTNRILAQQILEQGGALVSEYPAGQPPIKQNFIARNRIMAGLGDGILVTEAGEKSGSLHTTGFGLGQGKHILAVPGAIYSPTSVGTNNLLKQGATIVTSYTDVMHAMELHAHGTPVRKVRGRNQYEQSVLDLMLNGTSDGEELLKRSGLDISQFNQVLTMLEIGGKVKALGANHWCIA